MRLVLFIFFIHAFAKAYPQEISPQAEIVDFTRIASTISLDFDNESVTGELQCTFTMLKDASEVLLDAKAMQIVSQESTDISVIATADHIRLEGYFKRGDTYAVQFTYACTPKQAAYFITRGDDTQFWTQGQGKYTSHWLPSIDDMNDKIEFDISIFEQGFNAISNGTRKELTENGIYLMTLFDMNRPMASYLVTLVAGTYEVEQRSSSSGVPIALYYYPEDVSRVEPTYRHSVQIFDFLERELGVAYPWNVYRQVPVKDFLYAGMENTAATTFSDAFVIDSTAYVDRNYVTVNAHELAHQWFGNLVTETKSEHHWLHEGFATYYALLAEREIYGDDHFYFKLFESAEQLRELSDTGKGQTLAAAGGSSLTYYEKGAWALHILRELVGNDVFRQAVKNYLERYAFDNVTTQDFMNEVKALTSKDLESFEKDWLYQSAFQAQEALASLKKSDFMKRYFELQILRSQPVKTKVPELKAALNSTNIHLKQEAVFQLSGEPLNITLPLYKLAFQKNVETRQAIALSLQELTPALEPLYATLLNDKSYRTKETALYTLWSFYRAQGKSEKQKEVLTKLKNSFGFPDGNVRTLWLALSLATPTYEPESISNRYKNLVNYTDPKFSFSLRENAFRYTNDLRILDTTVLKNLLEACTHPNWRFRESSRKLLDRILQNEDTQAILTQVLPELSQKELDYLARIEK